MSGFLDFKLVVDGIDETIERLDLYDQKAIDAATHAMVENSEALLGKSMRIAPIDEGIMIGSASAKVQEAEIARGNDDGSITQAGAPPKSLPGAKITGTVSYNTPYAARQHEELGYSHKEGKQAKYLETPLKEFSREFAQNIADAIKDVKK
jgi:hypothetical protein